MGNVTVIGAQWGDEGKGKIVDWLASRADMVVRFQGGHNAGHTLVVGGETYKLKFGHHGGNHPVRRLETGSVEITSQNHNFAVDAGSFGDRATMTHVNLNDGVCEGLQVTGELAYSVQHHPEANPGPSDANYLFEQFADMMTHHNSGNGAR